MGKLIAEMRIMGEVVLGDENRRVYGKGIR